MFSENPRFKLAPSVGTDSFMNSRPLLTLEEIEIAIFSVQNSWDVDCIVHHLKENYGVQYSNTDLRVYISRWEKMCTDLDKPVVWTASCLNDHGISVMNRQKMYAISNVIRKLGQVNGERILSPTYRSIKWLDYMLDCHFQYLSGLLDLTTIADQYSTREIFSDSNGGLLDVDDIDEWLINRPWESITRYKNYVDLVNNRIIDGIKWPETMPINLMITSFAKVYSGVGRAALLNPLFSKCPVWLRYFRPSQIMTILFPDNDTKLQRLEILTHSNAKHDDKLDGGDESRLEEIMISLSKKKPHYIDGFRI